MSVANRSQRPARPLGARGVGRLCLLGTLLGLLCGAVVVGPAIAGRAALQRRSAGRAATTGTVPEVTMYLPKPLSGYPYARLDGTTSFEVDASDAIGVASVQFTLDGRPVGPLLTKANAGAYLYAIRFDTSSLTPGVHLVSALVTDNRGGTATAKPLSIKTGPFAYLPVLNYHGISGPLDTKPTIYDVSEPEAVAQLAYLKSHGYRSVTILQYQRFLQTGTLPAGMKRAVLITVDDGLTDEEAWDPLLKRFGFKAVLYVVTGFADNKTPGADHPAGNLSWAQIRALAADGRWEIGFHAGEYGHGDYRVQTNVIALPGGRVESFSPSCFYFYTCLGRITTTSPSGAKTTVAETPTRFEARVRNEMRAGIAELEAQVPTASAIAWVCPWNACGQWDTDYNDPSGTAQAWLPRFVASLFPIIFMETNPIRYGIAKGDDGSLSGEHREYRFQVQTNTTLTEFAAALTGQAFANN